MKKILIAIMCVLMFSTISVAGPKEIVLYHDESYPPYSYKDDDGKPVGIYVELLKIVDERLEDYVFIFEPVPWKRALNYMETGEGFAMFPPYFRPEERPWLDYSIFLMEEGIAAVIDRNNSSLPVKNWPEEFKDKVVGINSGFSFPIVDEFKDKVFKVDSSPSNLVALRKLREKRIDVYVNDSLAIAATIQEMKLKNEATPDIHIAFTLSKEMAFLAVSHNHKNDFKDDFVKQVNSVLNEMRMKNEIEEVVTNFLLRIR